MSSKRKPAVVFGTYDALRVLRLRSVGVHLYRSERSAHLSSPQDHVKPLVHAAPPKAI